MSFKWCVIVLVLWTTALVIGSEPEGGKSGIPVSDSNSEHGESSVVSGSDSEKMTDNRIKRDKDGLSVKVRLSNGSYIYRKMSLTPPGPLGESGPLTRVTRGYSKSKGVKGGYKYKAKKAKGYVYTTPRAKPISEETEFQNDSQFVEPPEPDPVPVSPDKSARFTTTTPAPVKDKWDIRDSVPGEPGRDYNVLGGIPPTNFSCEGKTPGFYADVETGCQVFHRCSDDPWYTGQVRVTMDSFLCPNGSLFNQQIYTCDWWGNVNCNTSPEFYQLNEQIGQLEETVDGHVQYVQFGGVRVPPPPGQKRKAPAIVPKSKRKPLPEKYRSKHSDGGHPDTDSSPVNNASSDENAGGGLSVSDDPDGLLEDFEQQNEAQFRRLSAETNEEDDRDESSIDEVTEPVPTTRRPSKKSSKKSSRRSKAKKATTTTTTTTTPASESPEDEESEESEEGDEEEPAATNNGAQGFIVSRGEVDSEPPSALQPPSSEFKGDPVDTGRKDDTDVLPNTEGPTYIPPTSASPTYIPPSTASPGYSYPRPNDAYLPPRQDHSYPPQRQDNNAYLPPGQANNAYLPPRQENNAYLPPRQENNAYLPPRQENNAYLPPRQENNAYLPPRQENNAYLPPRQENNAYLPPSQDNTYLPPSKEHGYISGASPPTATYLPPTYPPTYSRSNTYSEAPDSYYRKPYSGSLYSAATAPTHAYGQPQPLQTPNREYLPSPEQQYTTVQLPPTREYLPSSQSHNQGYANNYPQQPNREYLPAPHTPSNEHLPSHQQSNQGYTHPQLPNREYLQQSSQQSNQGYAPLHQPSREYLPGPQQSNQGYTQPQQPGREYLPSPQQSNQGYAQSQQPSREYLPSPPQQSNQGYAPPHPPSREYLPSPQQSNQGYTPSAPQVPNREYLPAPQISNKEYLPSPPQHHSQGLPSNQPQQPSLAYNANYNPPSKSYLPVPQTPNKDYLPSPPQQGYPSSPPSKEYLPVANQISKQEYLPSPPLQNYHPSSPQENPNRAYLASRPESSGREYTPTHSHSQNPSPVQVQDYSTNQNQAIYKTAGLGLVPPANDFSASGQQSQDTYQLPRVDYRLGDAVPTSPTQYSTIPVQTPPTRDVDTRNEPYAVSPPLKIDFFSVPLVSYSHNVDSQSLLNR